MSGAHDNFTVGTTVGGRFVIEEPVGAGPAYMLYLARDRTTDAMVSLKAFSVTDTEPPLRRTEIAELLRKVEKSSVDRLRPAVAIGEHDGIPWLARPWIAAVPLSDLLRAQRQMEAPDAIALIALVARECDNACNAGLVGVDLSPRPTLLVPALYAVDELHHLAAIPLRRWPAFEISVEPLLAKPTAQVSAGDYLFIVGQPDRFRHIVVLLCDLLGRGGIRPSQTTAPIVPALGERGNSLIARAWTQPAEFRSAVEFAEALHKTILPPAARQMGFQPRPIETATIKLPSELVGLVELLAEHNHNLWAQRRFAEGWRHGPTRDDTKREHPDLVAYAQLTESEKEYDRENAVGTLKAILALGGIVSIP